jgi:hypothetical protein
MEVAMTTSSRGRGGRARPAAGRDVRLYLGAALAGSYVVAWCAFGLSRAVPAPRHPGRDVAWYGEVAMAARPALDLPAGWQLAGAASPVDGEALPTPTEVAPTARIRTRSS